MTLEEAFDKYREDRIVFQNQSRKTEEQHQGAKKSLIKFTGNILLEDLTFDMVRQWKQSMESRHRSPDTIRGYLIKIRNVLRYCRLIDIPCMNYELIQLPKKRQKVPDFINPDDVTKLIEAANAPRARIINRARNKAIIALLFSSGIRVSELCRMDIRHVKYDFFTLEGKGGSANLSFIDPRARALIDSYLELRTDNNPALFIADLNKKRINPGGVQEILKNVRHRAGLVEHVTPHTLRHSFATDLMRNGADIRHVQALMHHSSIQTTQVYLHVVDNELQKLHTQYHTS